MFKMSYYSVMHCWIIIQYFKNNWTIDGYAEKNVIKLEALLRLASNFSILVTRDKV